MTDARALWVNPAGFGPWSRASVHLDLAAERPGARGRLRQVTAGFETGGLSFGYQRDVFDSGVHGHAYRLGVGAERAGLAAGFAVSMYRGDTKGTGWDAGLLYRAGPVTVGGTLTNVKQPVVRGVLQRVTAVPGITLHDNRGLIAISAEGRITPDSALGCAAGVRVATSGRVKVALLARIDTDRSFGRTGWTFGVSIGTRDILGLVASTGRAGSRGTLADLYGVSTRAADR